MTKRFLSALAIMSIVAMMMLSSCKTLSVAMTETNSLRVAPVEVTLDDFELGEIVSFETEITRENKYMYRNIRYHPERFKEYIIAELLKENPGYDVLLFPKFQSTRNGKVKQKVYLTGRLAKVKNKNNGSTN